MPYTFHFDSTACSGCKACQIACKDKNSLPVGIRWRRVWQYGGGGWTKNGQVWQPSNVFNYSISVSCMHCENPACVNACPTRALVLADTKDLSKERRQKIVLSETGGGR